MIDHEVDDRYTLALWERGSDGFWYHTIADDTIINDPRRKKRKPVIQPKPMRGGILAGRPPNDGHCVNQTNKTHTRRYGFRKNDRAHFASFDCKVI